MNNLLINDQIDLLKDIHYEIVNKGVPQKIVNEQELEETVGYLSRLKAHVKTYDTIRKEHVTPLNELVKETNGKFNKYLKPMKAIEILIKQEIDEYYRRKGQEEQEKKRVEEEENRRKQEGVLAAAKNNELDSFQEKILLDKLKKESEEALNSIEEPDLTVKSTHGTMNIKKKWDFEVININDVPREYLKIDTDKVMETIDVNGVRDIKGLRIFQKNQISVRS